MIGYNPKDASDCWSDGDYDARLLSVEEKKSSKGNDMYVLIWECYRGADRRKVWDYIAMPKMSWKLKKIARAFGMEDVFADGKFDPSACVNGAVTLAISTQQQDGYDDKNVVSEYKQHNAAAAVPAASRTQATPGSVEPIGEEDIPF